MFENVVKNGLSCLIYYVKKIKQAAYLFIYMLLFFDTHV